jgi:hypothetical protein
VHGCRKHIKIILQLAECDSDSHNAKTRISAWQLLYLRFASGAPSVESNANTPASQRQRASLAPAGVKQALKSYSRWRRQRAAECTVMAGAMPLVCIQSVHVHNRITRRRLIAAREHYTFADRQLSARRVSRDLRALTYMLMQPPPPISLLRAAFSLRSMLAAQRLIFSLRQASAKSYDTAWN